VPILGVLLVGLLTFAGCGGERTFEPAEFVEEANGEGANLVLGEPLTSIEEGVDVYAISFAEEADGEGHSHSGGSLIVTDDADAAREEHLRCEEAVTLVCYRAANVVLMFDAGPSDRNVAAVDSAIRALASQ
jgi:hypothetical protein